MPAAAMAAFAAALPSCTAVSGVSTPWNAPIGVRLAETMTTSCLALLRLSGESGGSAGPSFRRATCPAAGAAAGGERGGAGPRPQPAFEYGHERRGDLRTGKAL